MMWVEGIATMTVVLSVLCFILGSDYHWNRIVR